MRYGPLAIATALLMSLIAVWLAEPLIHARVLFWLEDWITDMLQLPPLRYRLAASLVRDPIEPQEIPGAYTVYLREGHSLEDHKTAVRWAFDLDEHIQEIFTGNPPQEAVSYIAHGIVDTALRAIRTDQRVSLVE